MGDSVPVGLMKLPWGILRDLHRRVVKLEANAFHARLDAITPAIPARGGANDEK